LIFHCGLSKDVLSKRPNSSSIPFKRCSFEEACQFIKAFQKMFFQRGPIVHQGIFKDVLLEMPQWCIRAFPKIFFQGGLIIHWALSKDYFEETH
jgi:hypothetical protein